MADVERFSLDEVVVHFAELEDPRSAVNLQHPLVSVVVIAMMAVLAGRMGGPTAIARWAALKEEFLVDAARTCPTASRERMSFAASSWRSSRARFKPALRIG